MHNHIYKNEAVGKERLFYNSHNKTIGHSLEEVYANNSLSKQGLSWFLEIGFVPGNLTLFDGIYTLPNGSEIEWNGKNPKVKKRFYYENLIIPEQHEGKDYQTLLEEGIRLCKKVVGRLFEQSHQTPVVMLTSGLDSRLILGAILESTSASNIESFTWGIPGTYDYEISKKIARKYDIKHTRID